jgi:hypothetical protein
MVSALLALIGIIAIFAWQIRWAVHGFPFHRHGFHHVLYGRSTAVDILEPHTASTPVAAEAAR